MEKIILFSNIKDYIEVTKLPISHYIPEFVMYRFDEVSEVANFEIGGYKNTFFEISLNISASCSFVIDDIYFNQPSKTISFINPYSFQNVKSQKKPMLESTGFTILFDPDFIPLDQYRHLLINQVPHIKLKEKALTEIVDIFNKIHYEYNEYGSQCKDIIRFYLLILLEKYRIWSNTATSKTNKLNREAEVIQEFEWICRNHLHEIFTVSEIAHRMHITADYLSKVIRKSHGKSALEILHDYRLTHAKALLKHTNLTPTQIAHELNFENQDYFFTFFKRKTGMTPTKFRDI